MLTPAVSASITTRGSKIATNGNATRAMVPMAQYTTSDFWKRQYVENVKFMFDKIVYADFGFFKATIYHRPQKLLLNVCETIIISYTQKDVGFQTIF